MIVFENKNWCIESDGDAIYITNAVSAETVEVGIVEGWNPLRYFCPKLNSWNRIPKSIRSRALKELDKLKEFKLLKK